MAVNDIYRITVVGSLNGEPVLNTFHYLETVQGTGTDETALGAAFNSSVMPSLAGTLVTAQSLLTLLIQGVRPVKPVVSVASAVAAGTNLSGSGCLQVAVVLTRKTATPGKGGRGRLFVGAVPDSVLIVGADHMVNPSTYNILATAMTQNLSTTGYTFVPVLFKRRSLTFLPITSVVVNRETKTRRSRAFGTRFHRRRRHTVGSI